MPESVEMPAPVRTTMRPAASTQPRTRPMTASRSRSLIGRILYTLFVAALPDPLPDDPLPLVESWRKEAAAVSRTATAMTLATVTPDGRAAARMVICRGFDARAGWLVFYTDRESDKGRDLAKHPQAALVFHWEALERQVRVDGPVTLAPDADSDRYWATRPRDARVAAAASLQSRPLGSRAELLTRVAEAGQQYMDEVPRPPTRPWCAPLTRGPASATCRCACWAAAPTWWSPTPASTRWSSASRCAGSAIASATAPSSSPPPPASRGTAWWRAAWSAAGPGSSA